MKRTEFIERHKQFQLGDLPTEQPHPMTQHLSTWAVEDRPRAVEVLRQIDLNALKVIESSHSAIDTLSQRVQQTRHSGGRIFLCGCGATGRLSLTIEQVWRSENPGDDSVLAFMAGGDVALVHSLEGFEDYPEFGARHLKQLGFTEKDLLIGITEGGETPYVIGATEEAAQISNQKPFFIFCNPTEILKSKVARSKSILENSKIDSIDLSTGPMVLAGSTRMQASTVLQLFVGLAVLGSKDKSANFVKQLIDVYSELDLSALPGLIEKESACYKEGKAVLYKVDDYAITVFTDTTERAPTFSLWPFENLESEREPSLCYVSIERAQSGAEAWSELLGREPRLLEWLNVEHRTSVEYAKSFDFSINAEPQRQQRLGEKKPQEIFYVKKQSNGIILELAGQSLSLRLENLEHPLLHHLLLKMVLNIHSTLVMGVLGRYVDNMMTWVFPTNGKLVDRSVRYIQKLLENRGKQTPEYLEIAEMVFTELEKGTANQSVVMNIVNKITR